MKRKSILYLCLSVLLAVSGCAVSDSEQPAVHQDINTGNETEKDTSEEIENSADTWVETGIDLYGMYDQNDCLIVAREEEYKGTSAEIPQIEGLKDENLQEKLNQDIEAKIYEASAEYDSLYYLNYQELANFSNVLSLGIYMGSEDMYQQIYLNYNLVTGETLKLEDLFKKDADVLSVIRNAFYEMMVQEMMFEADEQNIVSPDENRLYKVVKAYSNNPEKEFAFSPSGIFLYHKDSVASVDMIDYAEDIVIYSKYLTEESIFTKDDVGLKDIFTCVDIPANLFATFDFGYLEKNLWYDITMWQGYIGEECPQERANAFSDFQTSFKEHIYTKLEEYRKVAQANPDQFYIFAAKPQVVMECDSYFDGEMWIEDFKDTALVNENIQMIEMPYEMYENDYIDKLIEAYRYEYFALQGGVYLPTEEEGILVKEINEESRYNYMSGIYEE